MRSRFIHFFAFFIIAFHSLCIWGQDVSFKNITISNGLSGNLVNSITQDKYGFIWIGTENGLDLYDGNNFTHFKYQADDKNSIPGNSISSISIAGDSLWIGTSKGLCYIDVIHRSIQRVDIGENTTIRELYLEGNHKVLWIGTNSGLIRLNLTDFKYTEFNTHNSNLQNNIIRAIYKDSDRNLWVGTFDKLHKLPENSSVFEVYNLRGQFKPYIKNNLILSIQPSSCYNDKMLWIGTQTDLIIFSRITGEMTFINEKNSGLPSSSIKTILVTNKNERWLGTDFGLVEMDSLGHVIEIFHHEPFNPRSLVNSIVWSSFSDHAGNLWFGTNNGISIFSNRTNRFSYVPIFFERDGKKKGYELREIIEAPDKNLWFSTRFGILNSNQEKDKNQLSDLNRPDWNDKIFNNTNSIFIDHLGRLWIATTGGIYVWDSKNNSLANFSANSQINFGLRSNYIKQFIEAPGKCFLVNTFAGLHRLTGDFNRLENVKFDLITDLSVYSSIKQGDGYFWFTNGNILYRVNQENLKVERINFSSSNQKSEFTTLCFSHDHKIWMGSIDGLYCYNLIDGKDTLFKDISIEKEQIINLIEDDNGNIWGSTYSAILKFSPATKAFEYYPIGNDLPISHFEPNSCTKGSNGILYFIDLDGFVRFLPENVVRNTYQSPLRITTLSVQNQLVEPNKEYKGKIIIDNPISFSKSITLDFENRSFELGFSSLQFGNREGIRYAYKLEGIDPDWVYTSRNKVSANYTLVPSGNYLFKVKGTNTDGVWNQNDTTLKIRVNPPFWASPLFVVIYLILIVGLTLAILYYYSNKMKWQNQLRIIRLEKEHSEEMNQAKMQFFTNVFHEFRTPLSLIIGPINKLAQNTSLDIAGKKLVKLLSNNTERLIRLNNQLLDFRQLENKKADLQISEFDFIVFARNTFELYSDKASRKEIEYSFVSDLTEQLVIMDLEKVETILFNILSNAFKFTKNGGSITLKIERCDQKINDNECICFRVRDTGIGIAEKDQKRIFERYFQSDDSVRMERGIGIGLTLVDEYVKMHFGVISVQSATGKGTEFRILLPVKQAGFSISPVILTELHPKSGAPSAMDALNLEISEKPVNISGKPSLLLVENDKELLDFMVLSLNRKYNILIAGSGEEGLKKAEKNIPDLIVSDIMIPGLDGLTMIRKLKKNQRTAHIPVIILSAQAENQSQLEGFKSGADAYMIKPFIMDHLEARIENFIAHSIQLAKHLKTDTVIHPRMKEAISGDEKILRKIIAAIEKQISFPELSVETLSKETGLSRSIIFRKIKNLTGLTTNELIRKVKLQNAEQLLKTKKYTVAEVMDQVGFSNHSYFSKCFRKMYHMSPGEYMDQH